MTRKHNENDISDHASFASTLQILKKPNGIELRSQRKFNSIFLSSISRNCFSSESEEISQNISKLLDQQLHRTASRLTERDKENERRREFVETIERSMGYFAMRIGMRDIYSFVQLRQSNEQFICQ